MLVLSMKYVVVHVGDLLWNYTFSPYGAVA